MAHKSWNVPKLCTQESSCRLWGSARLTYLLCAFVANVLQMGMRNMLGLIILHMVPTHPREALQSGLNNITMNSTCGSNDRVWVQPTLEGAQVSLMEHLVRSACGILSVPVFSHSLLLSVSL